MPAEWEPHRATYLVWPHNRDTWAPGGGPVRMDRIELLPIATNDSWIRDFGPIFVNARVDEGAQIAHDDERSTQIALDFRFNSWGEKYGDFHLDDAVPRRLGERYGLEVIEAEMVLEGGSIDVNGAGAVLTTESCLLNKNRNPHLS